MSTPSESAVAKPSNKLEAAKKAIHDFLYQKSAFSSVFEQFEKYTKLKREYIFLGLIGFLAFYLVVGYGAGLVVNLLGFVYPAYKSCKAIDSEEKDDDTQWLTYWVVYAFFGIIEYFTDILLSWIPFYFLAKCAFLIWCMLPMENSGSMVIYHRLIKPFIKKHEKTIEETLGEVTHAARDLASSATSAARDVAGNIDLKQVQQFHETFASSDKPEKQD